MAWLMRGLQSAIFHYLSCAPCTEYMHRQERRKQAKKDRKARRILEMEQPGLYRHPEPSATNPFWTEEIVMGPGPPPRRARRQTTSSQRAITTAGTQSTMVSQGGSSVDVGSPVNESLRMSDETLDNDQNWNRRRYQREDEELWGLSHSADSDQADVPGSSVGIVGISRPETSKSSGESYFIARAPPVNDLHPPVVSLPSPHPEDNRWMLQPPPKASIMSGKEPASNRSRSGSGASSRVELSLQRQVSAKQLQAKIERGQTPELPPLSREASYTNFRTPKTPQLRPRSTASSRKKKKRRDTAVTPPPPTIELWHSSAHSSDTVIHIPPPSAPATPPRAATPPTTKLIRIRSSRQRLSTLVSSGSAPAIPSSPEKHIRETSTPVEENSSPPKPTKPPTPRRRPSKISSTHSSDSIPYITKRRGPLMSSDVSSLNILQDLVSPAALLNSRFVSAPLMEARIRLPPSDVDEEKMLQTNEWAGSGFGVSRGWEGEKMEEGMDKGMEMGKRFLRVPERDPRIRWSVDF